MLAADPHREWWCDASVCRLTRGLRSESSTLRAPAILGRNSLGEPCRGRYVPAADAERFIAGWELTGDYLMSQPGYVDTALHQAVTPNADFQFVNIGRWQTAEDFLAATQSQGFREAAMGLTDFRPHPGLYRIVRT